MSILPPIASGTYNESHSIPETDMEPDLKLLYWRLIKALQNLVRRMTLKGKTVNWN